MDKKKEKVSKVKGDSSKFSKNKIFLGIFVLILLLLGIFVYFTFFNSPTIKNAYISKLSGNVEVDLGNGYQTAKLNQELFLNSKIRTNEGNAVIILQGKVVSIIEKSSEIEISSLESNNILLKQSSGRTWNKFKGILGVDNFEVQTPNAVASVRSTEFEVSFDQNGESYSIVVEGKVQFKDELNNEILLNPYEGAKTFNNTLQKFNLSKEDLERIKNKKQDVLEVYKNQRLEILNSNKIILNTIKKTYNLDDAQIKVFLDKIDNGELDARTLAEKSPIKISSIDTILEINDKIQIQLNEIKEIDTKINETIN